MAHTYLHNLDDLHDADAVASLTTLTSPPFYYDPTHFRYYALDTNDHRLICCRHTNPYGHALPKRTIPGTKRRLVSTRLYRDDNDLRNPCWVDYLDVTQPYPAKHQFE
jgi:hypothetical protein